MTTPARLLNVDETARYLGGIHRSTVYDMVKSGKLTPVRVSRRRTMFDRLDLDAYIEATKAEAVAG